MKDKAIKRNWNWRSWRTRNFSTNSVVIICIFFFLAGFFGYPLFFQSQVPIGHNLQNGDESGMRTRPRARLLESTKQKMKYNMLRTGELGDKSITSIPFQVLSWRPRALYFPNFLSSEQCQTVIDMARDRLRPSQLGSSKGNTDENTTKSIRTSYGVFLCASEDNTRTLDFIEEKIARASQFPRSHFEAFNVLRYQFGQKYDAHFDTFSLGEYNPKMSQRVATFLMYLSDVEEGGETAFPFENGMNMDDKYNIGDCIGLKVKPRKGDAILFYLSFPNATIDQTAVHMSCPVKKGEKWAAAKWIRSHDMSDFRRIHCPKSKPSIN